MHSYTYAQRSVPERGGEVEAEREREKGLSRVRDSYSLHCSSFFRVTL